METIVSGGILWGLGLHERIHHWISMIDILMDTDFYFFFEQTCLAKRYKRKENTAC